MERDEGSEAGGQSRRAFLRAGAGISGAIAATGLVAACSDSKSSSAATTTSAAPPSTPVTNGAEALQRLHAGNKRFTDNKLANPGRDDERRAALTEDQKPFAVIVGCSDSRVPPEIIFDEGIGDLFTVRVAGNSVSTGVVQGTIEYGTAVLGSVLVVVLGHENCGAVKAGVAQVKDGPSVPGQIASVVEPIIPAASAEAVKGQPAEMQLAEAIKENVRLAVAQLAGLEPVLAPAVRSGKVMVVGANYHFLTGAVEFLT